MAISHKLAYRGCKTFVNKHRHRFCMSVPEALHKICVRCKSSVVWVLVACYETYLCSEMNGLGVTEPIPRGPDNQIRVRNIRIGEFSGSFNVDNTLPKPGDHILASLFEGHKDR